MHHRHHYFLYNALDDIGEITHQKRRQNNSPSVQGPPVEHLNDDRQCPITTIAETFQV